MPEKGGNAGISQAKCERDRMRVCLFAFIGIYLRSEDFICVQDFLFALKKIYLRSQALYLRSTKFDKEKASCLGRSLIIVLQLVLSGFSFAARFQIKLA